MGTSDHRATDASLSNLGRQPQPQCAHGAYSITPMATQNILRKTPLPRPCKSEVIEKYSNSA